MREILFRGKRYKNGEWVYGNLLIKSNDTLSDYLHQIVPINMHEENLFDFVIPETVGQYTGLNDSTKWEQLTEKEQSDWLKNHTIEEWNGKKIFEGDYWIDKDNEHDIMVVEYRDGQFCFVAYGYCGAFMPYGYDETGGSFGEVDCISFAEYLDDEIGIIEVEIIGNIHDNPELLKGSVTDTNVGNITEKGGADNV